MRAIKSQYVREQLAKLGKPVVDSVPAPKKPRARQKVIQDGVFIPMTAHTKCKHHIMKARKKFPGPASWFDVRDAYLAGYAEGYREPR